MFVVIPPCYCGGGGAYGVLESWTSGYLCREGYARPISTWSDRFLLPGLLPLTPGPATPPARATNKISHLIRTAMRRTGVYNRPYVLRCYAETQRAEDAPTSSYPPTSSSSPPYATSTRCHTANSKDSPARANTKEPNPGTTQVNPRSMKTYYKDNNIL
jgi:hypothetical protein